MDVYCLVSEFVLLVIAESSTIYVTSDLVPLSAHVREQVHNWRYILLLVVVLLFNFTTSSLCCIVDYFKAMT